MSAPAYMLSLLARQRALLGAGFFERYTSDWLVWEPGPTQPTRSMASSNIEQTHQPSASAPLRPEGKDALCFELRRVPGASLTVGRATENEVVIGDLTVSRAQFVLEYADRKWRIKPRGGALHVDGQAVPEAGVVLVSGGVISAGDVRLTYYGSDGFPARLQAEGAGR